VSGAVYPDEIRGLLAAEGFYLGFVGPCRKEAPTSQISHQWVLLTFLAVVGFHAANITSNITPPFT
jgi:hypothetical protein